jgi:hypothetical protein
LAYDAQDQTRVSSVRDWTARVRLKYQLHDRGDHYEVELLALPRANGIAIRYTTDGSSPTGVGFATYNGPFRVPDGCRVICAMAVCAAYDVNSETIRIAIPTRGEGRPALDQTIPAKWSRQTRLDDSGAVWDFIQRVENTTGTTCYDINITAESADGQQNIDYSGALAAGYDAAALRAIADKMQDIVQAGSLRMTVGAIGFPSGQALLDWLRANNIPFSPSHVAQ